MDNYYNKLTLAQKLGIFPAPPKPLSLADWKGVKLINILNLLNLYFNIKSN